MSKRILRRQAVTDRTGLPKTTIDRLEAADDFPKRIRITERTVGWDETAIDKWIEDRLSGKVA